MTNMYEVRGTGISYDIEEYQLAADKIRNARDALQQLPKPIRNEVNQIVQNVAIGMLAAFDALYRPLIDHKKEWEVRSSRNDYHTDLEGLRELPDLLNERGKK